MSIVKIKAIEVPAERADTLAQRFAAWAGEVGKVDGFEVRGPHELVQLMYP